MTYAPLTPDRWDDLERLFGERGACAGCWCMWWRLSAKAWTAGKGAANRKAFRSIVADGEVPGVLAYDRGEPVGWCAVAPREAYLRLANARTLKPIDDRPVWSITCLFVRRDRRRRGVSAGLIDAAAKLAASRGATLVEGYPVDSRSSDAPAAFVWTGLPGAFARAGFSEVARPAPTRPIYRRELKGRRPPKASGASRPKRTRGSSASRKRSSR